MLPGNILRRHTICVMMPSLPLSKKRQGSDGFMMVDDERYDRMYALVLDNEYYNYTDYPIVALRVKDERLELLYDNPQVKWSVEDVAKADIEFWWHLDNANILSYPTLSWILEVLTEYENDD